MFSPSPNPSFPPSPTPQSKNQFSIFTFPQPNSEDHPLLELYNKCASIHGEAHQEQVGRWSLDENKRKTVDLWWSIIAWRAPFCADKISSEMGSTGLCHNSYLIWQFWKIMKTRLTYNCAHLRSTKESLTIWVKFFGVKIFLGEGS